ncbi:MAG: hypothetical protein AB8C84_07320 [Oligoflexales bacterium]
MTKRLFKKTVLAGLLFHFPYLHAVDPQIVRNQEWEASDVFWKAFQTYENHKSQKADNHIHKNLNRLHTIAKNQSNKNTEDEYGALKKAASYYLKALQKQNVDNDGAIQLRLGYTYFKMCEIQGKEHQSCDKALDTLKYVIKKTPKGSKRQASMYMRSLLYEQKNSKELAQKSWGQIITQKKSDRYTFHAHIAQGDDFFEREISEKAYLSFHQAFLLSQKIPLLPSLEKTRIYYRIMWASYRTGRLKESIEHATLILKPGQSFDHEIGRRAILKDAQEIMADALYELKNHNLSMKKINSSTLKPYITEIVLRLAQRMHHHGEWKKSLQIALLVKNKNSLSKNQPKLLNMISDLYQKNKNTIQSIATLSELAMLLPHNSLWRQKNKSYPQHIKKMEQVAESAAISVAAWHYKRGLGSKDKRSLKSAATFYKILSEYNPKDPKAHEWKMRWSHCQSFSHHFDHAIAGYQMILSDKDSPFSSRENAAYQMIKVYENRLQETWQKISDQGRHIVQSPQINEKISQLEKSVTNFIHFFPDSKYKPHILLSLASAYRDIKKIKKAESFWEQTLLSGANSYQRSIAIQGLIYSNLERKNYLNLITICERFLRFEKWGQKNKNLQKELYQILAATLSKQNKIDMKNGQYKKSAERLHAILNEFKGIPKRTLFSRDTAYLYALSGDWKNSEEISHKFITHQKKSKHLADMYYIKARSQEYRFKFTEAAKSYQNYLQKFPNHSHAKESRLRAVHLALADENFILAAGLTIENMKYQPSKGSQIKECYQATKWLLQANSLQKSLKTAQECLNLSSTRSQILQSRLLIANLEWEQKDTKSQMTFKSLLKDITNSKNHLSPQRYADFIGEIHLQLAFMLQSKFHSIDIQSQPHQMKHQLHQKTLLFEKISHHLEKAGSFGSQPWNTQASYELGKISDHFANEIAMVQINKKKIRSLNEEQRYHRQIKRLQKMARRWHSHNILRRTRKPGQYNQDIWIKKSSIALQGVKAPQKDRQYEPMTPFITHYELPQQWMIQ